MKKLVLFILVLVVVTLTGCAATKKNDVAESSRLLAQMISAVTIADAEEPVVLAVTTTSDIWGIEQSGFTVKLDEVSPAAIAQAWTKQFGLYVKCYFTVGNVTFYEDNGDFKIDRVVKQQP